MTIVTPEGKDAIAVWQHQGDTWDIYYSIWDHGAKQWYVPAGGKSAPIAMDPGDDHDPDVSSNDEFAVAVWDKQTGGDTIYYSTWNTRNWTAPAKLSSSDQDTDPTVAVDAKGDALAVWVSQGQYLYSSYYTKGIGWTSPERLETTQSKVSLPELAQDKGVYYLVFTGTDGTGASNAYAAVYSSNGWTAPFQVGAKALLDNNVPTVQRTGISAAETKKEVTVVWPGPGNELYSAVLGKPSRNFADGEMPDVAYDKGEAANGAYSDDEDLFHQPDVNSPAAENTISALKASDDRASLTFIRDRSAGLALWWTRVIPTAQVYYSYYDNNQWMGVDRVDSALDGSYNRNPAVSPLRKLVAEEIPPYCGDKVINLPFEQCEVGIACPNPNDWCNLKTCLCHPQYPPDDSVNCAANTWASAFGFPIWAPGMICVDNCKASFGADWKCDPTCNCVKGQPPPPPKNVSCAANTGGAAFGISFFQPGDICKDDCDNLGENYFCDMKSCMCDQKPKKREVSCGANTWGEILFGKPGFKPGDICKDDCDEYGDNYECDATTCVCEEKPEEGVTYCAAHTQEVIKTDKNDFDPSKGICRDNCDKLGPDYVCVTSSCTCIQTDKQQLSCAGQTMGGFGLFGVGSNITYDSSKRICKDDCAQVLDLADVVCNMEKCICEFAKTCAGNTLDTIDYGKNTFKGGQCIDNCKKLGEGYQCDTGACLCRRSNDTSKVYCAANTDDALERGAEKKPQATFDPSTMQCIDNCKEAYREGYVCNAESCVCEPTEVADMSCSFNTQYVDATDKNKYDPSKMKCEDDCAEYMGSDYECVASSCTCVKKKKEVDCATNTVETLTGTGNSTFNSYSMQCKDNCEILSSAGLGDFVCDMQSCTCKPATLCATNTYEAIETGTNTHTAGGSFVSMALGAPICKDNCKTLGDGYKCDMGACVCRKDPGDTVYCVANVEDAYLSDSLNETHKRFDPSTQICKDNCEKLLGKGSVCDMKSCFCVPGENQSVSCAYHTDYVSVTDVNKFDTSKMRCKDDCAEYMPGYKCNLQSCTCTRGELDCSSRKAGESTTISAIGMLCRDDCALSLGSEWSCNLQGCYCEKTVSENLTLSCAGHGMGTVSVPGWVEAGYACKDDCEEKLGSGYYCDVGACACIQATSTCGDGILGYGEACDYGSAGTNKCPGTAEDAFPPYCTENCECKQIEHTPRCGDGKITYGEGCDGGNVKTNICPTGYKCYTPECKCIQEEGTGQCGDGTVTPPEECDHGNTYTDDCPGGKTCYSCRCVDPSEVPEEAYCGNNKREGSEECDGTDDSACSSDEDCVYCTCLDKLEEGYCGDGKVEAPEQCESNYHCTEGEICSGCQCIDVIVTYYYCGDGMLTGNEQCEQDSDCSEGQSCHNCQCLAPPSPDCESFCATQGFDISLGTAYTTGAACGDAASESKEDCYVKCLTTLFYTWTNPAGSTSCCCKDVYKEACPAVPGGCACPDEEYMDQYICVPPNTPR